MTTKKQTCAIYIRKSREDKDKPSQRLTVQREQLPAYAAAQGWAISIYDDGHASAAQGKTESLKARARLEADIRKGLINIILTIELSRLSRDDSLQDFVAWLDLCSRHHVRLSTMSRILDPAQHSDWMLLLMEGGFSSVEMRVLKARMNEGWQQAFRAGKWLTGPPPPPYIYDQKNSRPILDPDKLVKLQQIWTMAETNSVNSIAVALDIPLITVRRALSDERLLMYQAKRVDPASGETIACDWEPCMDAAQAAKIQAARRVRHPRRNLEGPKPAYASLLSAMGVFYCGYCGATAKTWQGNTSRINGNRVDYYGCQRKAGRTCEKSHMIKQTTFDRLLQENLLNTLGNIDTLKECWLIARGDADPQVELKGLVKKERVEEEKKRRLITAISEGVIEFSDAKGQIAGINTNIQIIKNERDAIIQRMGEHFDFDAISITPDEYAAMEISDRRELIHAAIERIDLYNSYAIVTYRFPRTTSGDCTSRLKLPPQEKPKKHKKSP